MLQENYGVQPVLEREIPASAGGYPKSIQWEVFADEEATTRAAAAFLANEIHSKPDSRLLLPTGRTPLLMYSHLVDMTENGQLDLSQIQTFNLDEFYGLAPEHAGSYQTYMQRVLFDQVAIPSENINLLNGAAPDPVDECEAYETKIKKVGGIGVAVLGIGANGHIGFNEPGSKLNSRTRLVTIRPETRAANAFLFNNRLEEVPKTALTVGIATILEAQRILLVATGSSKAHAIAALLLGPVTPDLPASCLRLHPDVTLMLDQKAALEIQKTTEF